MIKRFFITLLIIFYSVLGVSAVSYEEKAETLHIGFFTKVEKKYDLKGQIKILEKIDKKINKLFEQNNNFNKPEEEKIKYILGYFSRINLEKIIELKKDLSNQIIRDNYLKGENLKKDSLEEKTTEEKKIYLNDGNNEIKIKNYGDLFYDKDIKKIFDKYSSVTDLFEKKYYNKDIIFFENGVWYTYILKNYKYFDNISDIRIKDLRANDIDENRDLIFVTKNESIGFYSNPKKIKLISDDIIKNVNNKYTFLKEIKDDKIKLINNDYDETFKKIKNISQELTKDANREEKIKIIYDYIVNNLEYSQDFSINDDKIYSGVETFINKDGVCEGYVKLMNYMLLFSGVDDAEVIRGYVIDAEDFPDIGHAWFKIGNYYYDPTFDDPVGNEGNIQFEDYKYFKLPKDLIYANRFNSDDLPEEFKTKTYKQIEQYINNNLYNLAKKYRDSNYNVLKPYIFRIDNNFGNKDILDINDFKKILTYLEVKKDYSFIDDNGSKKYITFLNYFPVSDESIEYPVRHNFNYDINGLYLINWELSDGEWQYRLAYDVKIK